MPELPAEPEEPRQPRQMAERFRELVRLLVDRPDAVEVTEIPERRETILELKVDPEDLGKVIGRQGRTAQALRRLLDARGERHGTHYELEILED